MSHRQPGRPSEDLRSGTRCSGTNRRGQTGGSFLAQYGGERLLALIQTAFAEWRTFQQGHHDRDLMRDRLRQTWEALVDLLVEGADSDHDRVANFSAHLILRAEALWTFTEVPGCPPDNNLAERSLRKPVIWRRHSLGSQSEAGCRFVERILTTVESLRAQGRDVLAFLVETMSAEARGRGPPSLVAAPVIGS